jgi:hypothetical protein
MNTNIDYKTEKKGWVLAEPSTGRFLERVLGSEGGWYHLTDELMSAVHFRTKKAAKETAAKEPLNGHLWLVVPFTYTAMIEATRGEYIRERRAK